MTSRWPLIEFRFGEHLELVPSQNWSGDIPAVSQSPIFSSSGVPPRDCTPALNPTLLLPSGAIRHGQEPTRAVNSSFNFGGNPGLT